MNSRLHKAHVSIALLGPSTHCKPGRERRGRMALESFIANETGEPVEQVRDWAARQAARIREIGEAQVMEEIDAAFRVAMVSGVCEGRR